MIPVATMTDVQVRMNRIVQTRGRITMGRHGRAVLAGIRGQVLSRSPASSQPGLQPQYARAGPWYGPKSRKHPPAGLEGKENGENKLLDIMIENELRLQDHRCERDN